MFFEPVLIDPISIRGRVAFGITCLENVCETLSLNSPSMASLIDLLWTFTQSRELDVWEGEVVDALPENERDVSAYADKFEYSHLEDRDQQFVTELINAVVEIGCANLYAGFESSFTRDEAFAVAKMLYCRGYSVPDIERFRCSRVEEFHGWGDPISRDAFSK